MRRRCNLSIGSLQIVQLFRPSAARHGCPRLFCAKGGQNRARIGGNRKLCREMPTQEARLRTDMRKPLARRGPCPTLGGDIRQPRAESHHQIRIGKGNALRIRVTQAKITRIKRMIIREKILTAEGNRDGGLPGLRKGQQGFTPARCVNGMACKNDWALRTTQHGGQPRNISGRRLRGCCNGGGRDRCRAGLGQHIFRQAEHHRPRHALHRHGIGARDQFRHLVGAGRLAYPFRDAAEHAGIVNFLEGIAAQIALFHLPDQQDQRHRILFRRMHRDGGIAGARPARDEHHAGLAGHFTIGHRHEARAAFTAAGHQIHAGMGMQRIKQRDIAFTGHAKGAVNALGGEEFN